MALVFALSLVGLMILTDKLVMPLYVGHNDDMIVPDVVQKTFDEAKKILENQKFTVVKNMRYDKNSKPGTVVRQSPEPTTVVKSGRVIHLIVADDNKTVTVPSLKLSTLRDAQFNLQSLGLYVGKIDSQASKDFPEGIVVDQSVASNSKVKTGTVIDLVMSTGNNLTEAKVPLLVNKSLTDAKAMIVESGLRLGAVIKKYSSELLPGTVVGQSLDTVKTVTPFSIIDLTVSSTDKDDQ